MGRRAEARSFTGLCIEDKAGTWGILNSSGWLWGMLLLLGVWELAPGRCGQEECEFRKLWLGWFAYGG